MISTKKKVFSSLAAAACLAGVLACNTTVQAASALPNPTVDEQHTAKGQETMVLAGGCFWGVQAVFEHTKGVLQAVDGYSGGSASTRGL